MHVSDHSEWKVCKRREKHKKSMQPGSWINRSWQRNQQAGQYEWFVAEVRACNSWHRGKHERVGQPSCTKPIAFSESNATTILPKSCCLAISSLIGMLCCLRNMTINTLNIILPRNLHTMINTPYFSLIIWGTFPKLNPKPKNKSIKVVSEYISARSSTRRGICLNSRKTRICKLLPWILFKFGGTPLISWRCSQ